MKIGSLCSGTGGLDLAVENVFGATPAWFSEFDPAPSKILAHHWPDVPNYGDMTTIDWSAVEPVDIISGGTPCQDLSHAGARRGMTEGTRSNLWVQMREAVATVRPSYVVWENVKGAYSARADSDVESEPGLLGESADRPALRALGRVLGDLSELGYDTRWATVRASDAGAPHGRARVFVLAYDPNVGHEWAGGSRKGWCGSPHHPFASADDYRIRSIEGHEPSELGATREDWSGVPNERDSGRPRMVWGKYEPAIRRWENTLGRLAPPPTEPTGRDGGQQLSAAFSEWFMGLPKGWVTDPTIGLSKNQQIKACGNGVMPQQAELALRMLKRGET